MLDIKPYNKFWLNCNFNNNISVLTSIDKTYEDMALINCYSYYKLNEVFDVELSENIKFNFLVLHPFDEGCSNIIKETIITKEINIDKNFETLDTIKRLLTKNHLLVPVDLYDYIPNALCYKRYHWDHHSLVKNYDSKTDEFVVFEDDFDGYNEHRIPSEQFVKSIHSSRVNYGYILEYIAPIKKYNLELKNVINNAKRIVNELTHTLKYIDSLEEQFNFNNNVFNRYSHCSNQIKNRQIANILLINRLYELGYIDNHIFNKSQNNFNDLLDGWKLVTKLFLKSSIESFDKIDIKKFESKLQYLLNKEIETWNCFC